jgi:hypothetical protein
MGARPIASHERSNAVALIRLARPLIIGLLQLGLAAGALA